MSTQNDPAAQAAEDLEQRAVQADRIVAELESELEQAKRTSAVLRAAATAAAAART